MTAVLRVSGTRFDVDLAVRSVSASKVQCVWRIGELSRFGKPNATSGITLLLSELEGEEMVAEATVALNEWAPNIANFLQQGAVGEVDFALFVGARQPRSIVLEPATLRTIEQHGLRIVVSAYPVEEDDDQT